MVSQIDDYNFFQRNILFELIIKYFKSNILLRNVGKYKVIVYYNFKLICSMKKIVKYTKLIK